MRVPSIDLSYCRKQFPALKMQVGGYPAAFLDGPGGTQVPQSVIDAVVNCLVETNANVEGAFQTSEAADQIIEDARLAMADMLGANSEEICFGANMTTLNFALARAIAKRARPGDRIITTEMEHQANIDPWDTLAEQGIEIKHIKVDPETCTLDLADFKKEINPRTVLVAVTHASNGVGTINDVSAIARMAHEVGALMLVDAVHYSAHGPLDVKRIDCDFLLCSAYKFFGPHVGVQYTKAAVGEDLLPYKVRPQLPTIPRKFETGTLNHEGLAGVIAAVDFIASLGSPYEDQMNLKGLEGRRRSVVAGMRAIEEHEKPLLKTLLEGLSLIPGVRVYGPPAGHPRTPTVSFTLTNHTPRDTARYLGDRGLFVWDGDFYATTLVERLGLAESGGLVRVGLAPYTNSEEIERLLSTLSEMLGRSGCRCASE